MEEKKNKGGRPKKYTDVEVMQEKIDLYFENCKAEGRPYTITGLALALDLDRKSLLNYSEDDKFFHTIKKAKEKVEAYAEERLYESNVTGVIFNLKNNFGWKDKTEVENNIKTEIKVTLDD